MKSTTKKELEGWQRVASAIIKLVVKSEKPVHLSKVRYIYINFSKTWEAPEDFPQIYHKEDMGNFVCCKIRTRDLWAWLYKNKLVGYSLLTVYTAKGERGTLIYSAGESDKRKSFENFLDVEKNLGYDMNLSELEKLCG